MSKLCCLKTGACLMFTYPTSPRDLDENFWFYLYLCLKTNTKYCGHCPRKQHWLTRRMTAPVKSWKVKQHTFIIDMNITALFVVEKWKESKSIQHFSCQRFTFPHPSIGQQWNLTLLCFIMKTGWHWCCWSNDLKVHNAFGMQKIASSCLIQYP